MTQNIQRNEQPKREDAQSVIRVTHMTKDYGNNKGIFDVTLHVAPGEVYGFLGSNGAGKTTTIRNLMGFIRPQSGSCQILGMDCFMEAKSIQARLGYLPGEIAFPSDMGGIALLNFLADMKGLKDKKRMQELIEMFELDPNGRVKRMSKGMKQKIGIVSAFMTSPRVLILDEPTSGLDPLMQNRFVELILAEKKKGTTIFMSSHMFEEIEKTCDTTAFIKDGRIVAQENMAELAKQKTKGYEILFASSVECSRCQTALQSQTGSLFRLVEGKKPAANTTGTSIGGRETLQSQSLGIQLQSDMRGLLAFLSDYDVIDITKKEQSLEEMFLQFYEKEDK